MPAQPISDDEVIYRRVPNSAAWFESPDRITTANFKLDRRRGDLGLSVYRASIVSPRQVLERADVARGTRLASATVANVRALASTSGAFLGLDVVAVDDARDPGHAEIRGPEPGKLAPAASKALRDLFRIVAITFDESES